MILIVQVLGWDVERVKPLILGPVGAQITMTFQRVGSQVAGKRQIDVTMTRHLIDQNATGPPRRMQPFERGALGLSLIHI